MYISILFLKNLNVEIYKFILRVQIGTSLSERHEYGEPAVICSPRRNVVDERTLWQRELLDQLATFVVRRRRSTVLLARLRPTTPTRPRQAP